MYCGPLTMPSDLLGKPISLPEYPPANNNTNTYIFIIIEE
jgi:hypothetical protein